MTPEEIKSKIAELRAKYEDAGLAYDELNTVYLSIQKNPALDEATDQSFLGALQKLTDKSRSLKAESKTLEEELSKAPEDPKKDPENPEEPQKPERDPNQIYGSVGAGGKNDPLDVTLVQKLLNQRHSANLTEDGKSGKGTVGAIQNFQRCINGDWNACDGRIDVGGKTWKWLSGSQAIPALPAKPKPKPKPPVEDPVVDPKKKVTVIEVVAEGAKTIIDYFLQKYADKELDLAKFEIGATYPVCPGIAGKVSFYAGIKFKLEFKRGDGLKVTSTASVTAGASLSFGVEIGVPKVLSVEFGIQGWAKLAVETSISMEAKNGAITATLNAPSGALSVGADLYADITALGFGADVAWWLGKAIGCETDGSKLLYNLGKINLLEVTAPSYSLSVNKALSWSVSSQGSYGYAMHKDFKAAMDRVVQGVKNTYKDIRAEHYVLLYPLPYEL
jgi:peptidoglycan hydrolase-like protein with peptidoglycan-binding domain